MHVVTFYSYKGGTGRSMALVNVAAELVRAGRRVLIVDLDLEAPGLDTFNLPRPQATSTLKGVVDFVEEYRQTGTSPDVRDFVYRSPIPSANGQLWVMPAGQAGEAYDEMFRGLNWQELYDRQDGYLLFEDLKAQWNETIAPDYVFIDSRTGHTDVGGICTRQLPDAVVLFFFPNEQNRRGLATIVEQIRAESRSERKKNIKLHFVLSNVPELDDEEGFLANNVATLKESLKFDEFAAVIHHYNSLSLLTQSVFTLDRPRTRLAQEYRVLARAIRSDNVDDRDVALEFLDEVAPLGRPTHLHVRQLEEKIQNISDTHADDPEVLTRLAILLRRERRFEEALALLEQAAELGAQDAQLLMGRAELYLQLGKSELALRDVQSLLRFEDASYLEVTAAARLLLQLNPASYADLLEAPAFKHLDAEAKHYIATDLLESRAGLHAAVEILERVVHDPKLDPDMLPEVETDLSLALIGSGRFEQAKRVLTRDGSKQVSAMDVDDVFNLAMAEWGRTSNPPAELFARVVELGKDRLTASANFHQCLAISLWAVDRVEDALTRVGEAWQQIMSRPKTEFSAWSYLRLNSDDFLRDLKDVQKLLEGEAVTPRFVSENPKGTPKHD